MLWNRRSPHLAPGSAFLAAVLLVLLGLSAVLAYQAADAARSEARATERALRGFAAFANLELSRRADEALRHHLGVVAAATFANSVDTDAPALLAQARAAASGECACAAAVLGAVVADVPAGGAPAPLRTTPLPAGLEQALRTAAAGIQSADSLPVETLTYAGHSYLLLARRSRGGGVRGVLLSTAALAPAAFGDAYRSATLLPAPLRGSVARGDAVAAVVSDADGTTLWTSPTRPTSAGQQRDGWVDAKVGGLPPEPLARGAVSEPLGGLFAGLRSRVAVRTDAAGPLPDARPGGRLPLLLGVFGLTLALVCIAIFQLRRQQELVRLRDDFVSGVSHELRTPLAQIRLFADLLESGRLPAGDQRTRSIRIINEEARRLSWLVENILHFSRSQRGAGRVAPQPLLAAPLLHEIVNAFAPLAREREVRFDVAADEGVVVRADADALRQVLLNLLDNAVKYGPVGQTVRVRAELRGLALRVSVEDEGPGVPLEERPLIWEPYRRLPRDAAGATGGSGIGLAVVRDLVELHGGRTGVGDAPGGGANFWLELPWAMHAGPAPAEPSARALAAR
jgi:signal transduction histidine kinase